MPISFYKDKSLLFVNMLAEHCIALLGGMKSNHYFKYSYCCPKLSFWSNAISPAFEFAHKLKDKSAICSNLNEACHMPRNLPPSLCSAVQCACPLVSADYPCLVLRLLLLIHRILSQDGFAPRLSFLFAHLFLLILVFSSLQTLFRRLLKTGNLPFSLTVL